jgi:lipoyl synthase
MTSLKRLPPWFKTRLTADDNFTELRGLIRKNQLHTVCQSAACPNRTECWNSGTASFMILGNLCTRTCGFCSVPKGTPSGLDILEPERVAQAVASLRLNYAVITSVTRDDLSDGGASLFAASIHAIRAESPTCRVEVLIPDFQGSETALNVVLDAQPDVLNHNLETVPSLYTHVRPQADYYRSLEVIKRSAQFGMVAKSGLMLGLGEGTDEILIVLHDLRDAGCSILTLGQYLQPGKHHLTVAKYYHPYEFRTLREQALTIGFEHVAAGPLVRSSYHAGNYTYPEMSTWPATKNDS